MADQCIVCLDDLDPPLASAESPPHTALTGVAGSPAAEPAATSPKSQTSSDERGRGVSHEHVAVIEVCGHMLHDACLREWIEKANSCPVCRQSFHLVKVLDRVGGERDVPLSLRVHGGIP
jgi:hypothetical protein